MLRRVGWRAGVRRRLAVRPAGAAGIADLGGSSKYSGEQPWDARSWSGFRVNSDWTRGSRL